MAVPWESEGLDEIFFYARIRVRRWADESVLALVVEGSLGEEGAAEEFNALLSKSGEGPQRAVVLDIRALTSLPSKVLPALVSLRTRLAKRGGILAVVSPEERISRLLGLLGMEKVILITEDAESAYEAAKRASGRWDKPDA